MKSILLGVLAVTAQACAAKATAEDDDVGISCCGPEIEKYWIETLSDEQNTQVESIFETQREKRLDLREETRTLIRAILDEEQLAKMDEMRQCRKEPFAGGRPCHRQHLYLER